MVASLGEALHRFREAGLLDAGDGALLERALFGPLPPIGGQVGDPEEWLLALGQSLDNLFLIVGLPPGERERWRAWLRDLATHRRRMRYGPEGWMGLQG